MTESQARGRVDVKQNTIGEVSPRIFGGMIEHQARTVYGGVWDAERDIPHAGVKAAVAAMGTRALRYPGGGFTGTYRWRDGIGPKSERPYYEHTFWTEMGKHWFRLQTKGDPRYVDTPEELGRMQGPPEPNSLGTNEFLQYCLDVDAEPLLVVNNCTGTPEEAAEWVRYCNVDRETPRPVTWWAIGNESWNRFMEPNWTPDEYGQIVIDFATAMRAVDPSIKIVATGQPISSGPDEPQGNAKAGEPDLSGGMPHVAYAGREWNGVMLKVAGEHIDALDFHWYYAGMCGQAMQNAGEQLQIVTAPDLLNDILATTAAFADEVLGEKRIELQIGEWNRMFQYEDHLEISHKLADAAFFGGVYNAMLTNADRLKMAITSHLVNTLAPIQVKDGQIYVTASFLVAQMYEKYARGESVEVEVDGGPTLDVPPLELEGGFCAPAARKPRTAPQLNAAAVRNNDQTAVFLVNRSQEEPITVKVTGLSGSDALQRWVHGPSLDAANSVDEPDVLGIREEPLSVDGGSVTLAVPPSTASVVVTPLPARRRA